MRPLSRRLAPGAGTARPPPLGRQRAAPGDQSPPPPPPQAQEQKEAYQGNGCPAPPPKRPLHPGGRGHHLRGKHLHALPAAGRRRTGSAQDGANGVAPSEAGPGKTGAPTRAEGLSPAPPRPRRTDPLAANRARRPRPPGNRHGTSIPLGRHAGDNRWQADA